MTSAFSVDDFELFGLPVTFDIDEQLLVERYLKCVRESHPDAVCIDSRASQQQAMMDLTTLNKAYERLKTPLLRAEYVLKLTGVEIAADHALPPTFLMSQMELRESIDCIKSEAEKTQVISGLKEKIQQCKNNFSTFMASDDALAYSHALSEVGIWRFYDSAMKQAKHKEIDV